MWYTWTTLLLVSCALVEAEGGAEAATATTTDAAPAPAPVATTRAPPRTLDRQAAELAWKSWLQSPESGNQNAPPRRITTKSLFITPYVCPKGQRLDRNGCVQVVTVNKTEHERILLDQLNALFTSAPSGDVIYDYGDEDPGPLQLSIPIGLDPQAAPLHGQEPSGEAQQLQSNYVKLDKKDVNRPEGDEASAMEAELELLKLQNTNNTAAIDGSDVLNHNVLTTNIHPYPDKPKRDSPMPNSSEHEPPSKTSDEGQKEIVYGHVNVDPYMYNTENQSNHTENTEVKESSTLPNLLKTQINETTAAPSSENNSEENKTSPPATIGDTSTETKASPTLNSLAEALKSDGDQSKLNPEIDYSDIGEAIKLISRYADVTTDDNFTKDRNKNAAKDDAILGTRTKLQYRRNKPTLEAMVSTPSNEPVDLTIKENSPVLYPINGVYYRYPWSGQNSPTPPPDYPFRHLQDYWPGRNQVGGVYNTHENPRRHHHSYPHNYRLHGFPHAGYIVGQPAYPEQLKGYIRRVAQRRSSPMRSHTNNQDLYSLLGLRHWFSSEGTSKR